MLRAAQFSPPVRITLRLLWAAGGLGFAAFAVSTVVDSGPPAPATVGLLYPCLYLAPAALCLLRAGLVSTERLAWAMFGTAAICWFGGETYYHLVLATQATPPYPSISDAFWLTAYVCAILGLLLVMHVRVPGFRRVMWVDAAVGGLAIAGTGAALMLPPVLASTGGRLAVVATNLAYPLLDVLTVSVVIAGFVMTGGRPGRGWILLGAGFAGQLIIDMIYLYQSATDAYVFGSPLDATWPAFMLIIAFVAWQDPAVANRSETQGWPALALTATFALAGLGLLTYDHWHRIADVALVLATLTLLIAIVRMAMTFADMRSRDMRALVRNRKLFERNELILNAAGEAICGLDRHGTVTFANPAAAALTGWQAGELVGQKLRDTFPRGPADRPWGPPEESPLLAAIQGGRAYHSDGEVYVRADGSSFAAEVTSTLIREDESVTGAVVVFKDITERKATAELLDRQREQLVEAQSVGGFGSWTRDLRGGGVEHSEELCRIYGREPGSEPLSLAGVLASVHPDDRGRWEATVRASQETRHPLAMAFRIVRPDGTERVLHSRGQVIVDDQGAPLRMVGTTQDITERAALERSKDEFTSIVSHELRTPLTSIRGSLGLLASGVVGPLPEKGQRMVEIAVQNTDRLVRLVNDILDIERIESGTIDMRPTVCEARELIARATEALAPVAAAAKVILVCEAEAADPLRLVADPDRVIQTLTNLISNAVKFSPAGGRVRVSCSLRDAEVLFQVSDQGRGIPARHLESIFERFHQVDASDSRQEGGTGLGLAISRSIVEQHGGRIWAESAPGEGALFSFVLPAPDLAQDQSPPEPAGSDGPTVLVCDDDASVMEVVGALLEVGGYRVIATRSGEQAVAYAIAHPPDVILLDLLMPGMSGWETAAALGQHVETQNTPIVILSVLTQDEADRPAGPVVDWVQKPLDDARLFAALRRAIGARPEPFRVLVVEDDHDLVGVLTATFARHGVETFHAGNGAEAIEISQRVAPDLLVLDLALPEVDGFQVVEWLRRHDRLHAVPLVVYTARDLDAADRQRLRLGSTTEFLTKGRVTPSDFERHVMRLLGRLTATTERGYAHASEAHPPGR